MLKRITLRHISLVFFAVLGIFTLLTFRQYGISNDEEVQHIYGRLLLDFYSSGFSDQDAFEYRNLYLYGGFFDLVAALLEKIVPIWIWDLRHLLSALFGIAGIFAAYKIAKLLGGERAGLITILLLGITGAWTGAMFTHTKDVPFATCMTWALYYTLLISRQLPKPDVSLAIKLGIAIGCALGLRIGGVFAIFYLVLVICSAGWMAGHSVKEHLRFWSEIIIRLLPAALTAFALMALFWPWGVMSPHHPLEAAKAFSHFAFNMLTVMDGEVMDIGKVPRDYLPSYLFVRLPELFLLGLACLIGLWLCNIRKANYRHPQFLPWAGLVISAAFPLAFILLDRPALYNGIRHFTFLLPPLAVLSGLGLHYMLEALKNHRKLQLGFGLVCAILLVNTTITLIRLHPYEYIYYNELAGDDVYEDNDWEGDYWSSSLREASEMLESSVPQQAPEKPYKVAVCAESIQGRAYLDHRFEVTTDWKSADFFISTTNMNCDKVLKGKIIGSIERLGETLAVIKDRRDLPPNMRMPRRAPR